MSNRKKLKRSRKCSGSCGDFVSDSTMGMIMTHFPEAQGPADLSCEKCADFQAKACDGKGLDPEGVIRCMERHEESSETYFTCFECGGLQPSGGACPDCGNTKNWLEYLDEIKK